jgi:hypothetical protein
MKLPPKTLPAARQPQAPAPTRPGPSWAGLLARLRQSPTLTLGWAALLLAAVLVVPLFVCMPVWCDSIFYDLAARSVLRRGGVFRHLFVAGLPGMIWWRAGVRAVVGWNSAPLRGVDLAIVAASVWLLVSKLRPPPLSATTAVWAALALLLCYTGTTEWSHCQPDSWMLLPALAALCLRLRQTAHLPQADRRARSVFGGAVAEGVCWGAAFLVKPFVAFSALLCCLLTPLLVRPAKAPLGRRLLLDAAGVLAGGLLVGLLTVAVLLLSGEWPYFLDNTLAPWTVEYFHQSPPWLQRAFKAFLGRGTGTRAGSSLDLSAIPAAGSLLHLAAVPLALFFVGRAIARRKSEPVEAGQGRAALALLAAFYLGWFAQANFLQQQFEYHVVPCLLLALALLVFAGGVYLPRLTHQALLPAVLLGLVFSHPLLKPERLALWPRCFAEGSTPALMDALTLKAHVGPSVSWVDLERVADFLRARRVRDREVTCFYLSSLPLYLQLDLEPSSRFVMLTATLAFFPGHQSEILHEVQAGPQRYVVTDLGGLGIRPEHYDKPLRVRKIDLFPWDLPVVFRAGRYLVHEVRPRQPDS